MKKNLVLLLLSTALIMAVLQGCAPNPTQAPISTVQPVLNATPSLEAIPGYAAPAVVNPATTNPDETNSAVSGYPAPQGNTLPNGVSSDFAPVTADDGMVRGNFFIDSATLKPDASHPGQADLTVVGSLPTPCNLPRVMVSPPDAQNKIVVQAYSVMEKGKICTQNIEPFDGKLATISGFPSGKYTVMVNDKPAGELTVP